MIFVGDLVVELLLRRVHVHLQLVDLLGLRVNHSLEFDLAG